MMSPRARKTHLGAAAVATLAVICVAAACDWTGRKEHEARLLYDKAIESELEKDYDGALVALHEIEARYPRTGIARDLEEVRERIEGLLAQRNEEQAGELYNKALSLVEENQYDWALRLLDDVESHYPGTEVARSVAHTREIIAEEKQRYDEVQSELTADERRGRFHEFKARLRGGEPAADQPMTVDEAAAQECCCTVKEVPVLGDSSGETVITNVRVAKALCESGETEIVESGRGAVTATVRRTYLSCVSDRMCRR